MIYAVGLLNRSIKLSRSFKCLVFGLKLDLGNYQSGIPPWKSSIPQVIPA
jgi:hypothetical protein